MLRHSNTGDKTNKCAYQSRTQTIMLNRMTKSTQNLNSCSFHLQVVFKKLQVPPPDSPQKIYRCQLYVSFQRLDVLLMREQPEVLKGFFRTSNGSLIRYLFKSYKYNVQVALGKLHMPYPDNSQKLTDVMSG